MTNNTSIRNSYTVSINTTTMKVTVSGLKADGGVFTIRRKVTDFNGLIMAMFASESGFNFINTMVCLNNEIVFLVNPPHGDVVQHYADWLVLFVG